MAGIVERFYAMEFHIIDQEPIVLLEIPETATDRFLILLHHRCTEAVAESYNFV